MAKIVNAGIAGELSGKLGGQVFARNRAGAYVRQNAQPTNPNTLAQIRARSAFGNSSSVYHSLQASQKSGWQNLGDNFFVSKSMQMPGTLSGFNVFLSMRNTAANMNAVQNITPVITVGGTPASITVNEQFQPVLAPPSGMMQGALVDSNGNPFQIEVTGGSATVDANGNLATLSVETNELNPLGTSSIETFNAPDSVGADVPTGFACYCSQALEQEGMFVENPERYLVAATPSMTFDGGPTPYIDVGFDFAFNQSASNYQSIPQSGQTVRATLYQVSTSGQFRRVGSTDIVIP